MRNCGYVWSSRQDESTQCRDELEACEGMESRFQPVKLGMRVP